MTEAIKIQIESFARDECIKYTYTKSHIIWLCNELYDNNPTSYGLDFEKLKKDAIFMLQYCSERGFGLGYAVLALQQMAQSGLIASSAAGSLRELLKSI